MSDSVCCVWCGKEWAATARRRYVTMTQAPLPFLELARYHEDGAPLVLCASTRACRRRRHDADEAVSMLRALTAGAALMMVLSDPERVRGLVSEPVAAIREVLELARGDDG